MSRFSKLLIITPFLLLVALLSLTILSSPKASALSGNQFQAGRIMDNEVFFNPGSMSEGQIQEFLNAKVPVCDTNGTQPYAGTTRAAYGTSRGYPPPYTCLKDYSQMTTNKNPEDLLCGGHTAGNKSAARIIKEVADSCGVSPKVLIILLQKEQSLVTDDWPWSIQYRSATGYGCPDTAPCDAEYYGYFNQVYNAARIYKYYAKYPNSFNHLAGRNNNILYHPNSACGRSTVFIENQATAGLYNYTPYQPNAAALNTLYGTGDGCSAYGNRNFWRMFNDWFGPTTTNLPQTNLKWSFENLDGQNAVNTRTNTVGFQPHAVNFDNKLYVFHHNITTGRLELAMANSTDPWQFTTLDGNGGLNGRIASNVGLGVNSVVFDNTLHIFYQDVSNKDLRHAWLGAGSTVWTFETLDGFEAANGHVTSAVGASSTAVSYGNSIQLFYYDTQLGNLRHGWYVAGNGWRFENLEGDWGAVSGYNSDIGSDPVAIAYGGSLQLFYYDVQRGNLRHAWASDAGWKFENLDGDYGSISHNNSDLGREPTVVAYGNNLQLFYYDVQRGNLRHAWASDAGWKFENLDGDYGSISRADSDTGQEPIALVNSNVLYVFYRNKSNGSISHTYSDTGGWHFASLEGTPGSVNFHLSNTGFSPTAANFGSVQLFYFDNTQRSLRHAWGVNR